MAFAPLAQDFLTRIIKVNWAAGCRFAVCGYDGNFATPPQFDPVYFGVGAYSDDGKSWTPFKVFDNGTVVSIFHMRDPDNKQLVIVGGNTNDPSEDDADLIISTAVLTTIVGTGPNAVEGGQSEGPNVANFGSIGYDKKKKTIYAVDNSDDGVFLYTLELGKPEPGPSEQIFWAGQHHPTIEPVQDCNTNNSGTMTFKDKEGKQHTLSLVFGDSGLLMLHLDDVDITPPDARNVVSAAGGLNGESEVIIIAVGYHLIGDDDHGIAWWFDGKVWTEIGDIWSGNHTLQSAQMATAVPS